MSDQAYFKFEDVSSRVRVAGVLVERVLDETLIEEMGNQLYEQVGSLALIVDFKQVEYLSTAFFGKLIALDRKLQEAKGLMICCSVHPGVYEVFAMTRLNMVFKFADDLDAAKELAQKHGFE